MGEARAKNSWRASVDVQDGRKLNNVTVWRPVFPRADNSYIEGSNNRRPLDDDQDALHVTAHWLMEYGGGG